MFSIYDVLLMFSHFCTTRDLSDDETFTLSEFITDLIDFEYFKQHHDKENEEDV